MINPQYVALDQKKIDSIIWDFNSNFYNQIVNFLPSWGGHVIQKNPFDLWVYQEILFEIQPDLIIETGTYNGASAHYFASILDQIGTGEIITVDIKKYADRPNHPRITYLTGSSTDPEIFKIIKKKSQNKKVLVILDSNHSTKHVLNELNLYSPLVTLGSYLIVEDTNTRPPFRAIDKFTLANSNFLPDTDREKFRITFNPYGYLKRV